MADSLTTEQLDAVRVFLKAHSTLALATSDGEGRPQVAPVFYWSDDALNLYWLSSPTSRHSVNLSARPKVAATIYPELWMWQAIRGLQIEGEAGLMADLTDERGAILTAYRRKFQLPPEMDALITASTLYVLRPHWVRWLDNEVRFGFKAETRFE
jgi:uncharacterized protein YhbP (UPF0306 family)